MKILKKLYAANDKTKYALVDDDVFEIIKDMGLKFSIDKRENKGGYFRSTTKIKLSDMTEKKQLQLHHFVWILKTGEEPTRTVDHQDRNPSNNQFKNLRLATRQEQQQHRGKLRTNTSGYIGVSHAHQIIKYKDKKYEYDYWYASIWRLDGYHEHECFKYTDDGLLEAAHWYDAKAIEYHGEFAVLNFPMPSDKQ